MELFTPYYTAKYMFEAQIFLFFLSMDFSVSLKLDLYAESHVIVIYLTRVNWL